METKICCTCKNDLNLEEFNWRIKSKGLRSRECRSCHKTYNRDWYLDNHDRITDKVRKRNKNLRQQNRQYLKTYLENNPCIDCGNGDIRVLDFDHLRDKKCCINKLMSGSLEMIKEEIKKCEVRCSNCHRIKTYERKPCWRNGSVV